MSMSVFRKSERREGYSKGPTQRYIWGTLMLDSLNWLEGAGSHVNDGQNLNGWPRCLQGTISVGIDATDLFDRYEEEYEDVVGGGVPHLEINKMHISQSIEVIFVFIHLDFFKCGLYRDGR